MLKVSASHLKLFRLCPRSYYLKHVLRAPDDAGAGGQYLTRGNDFDRLVQLHVRDGVTGDSGAPRLANRQLAEARRYLPAKGGAEVQFAYSIPYTDPATGLVLLVNGKPDLRRPGYIQDTKTTSDRGPGRGAAEDRPAYALTDATLAEDEQALLYAWCEFQLDPALAVVLCEWIYVSKADCPKCWMARCTLGRAAVTAWFDAVVRPAAAEMARLHDSGLPASGVGANPDSCRRCFVRGSCPGAFEGVSVHGPMAPQTRKNGMAFDLSKLKSGYTAAAAPLPVLADQLAASVAAVQINRPATQRPACSVRVDPDLTETLVVHSIEGSAEALALFEYEAPGKDDSQNTPSDVAVEAEATPSPKARRGRPRKQPGQSAAEPSTSSPGAATVAESTTAGAPDPKALPGPVARELTRLAEIATTTAPGCASSAGDLAVAVSALRMARSAIDRSLAALGEGVQP